VKIKSRFVFSFYFAKILPKNRALFTVSKFFQIVDNDLSKKRVISIEIQEFIPLTYTYTSKTSVQWIPKFRSVVKSRGNNWFFFSFKISHVHEKWRIEYFFKDFVTIIFVLKRICVYVHYSLLFSLLKTVERTAVYVCVRENKSQIKCFVMFALHRADVYSLPSPNFFGRQQKTFRK